MYNSEYLGPREVSLFVCFFLEVSFILESLSLKVQL